MIGIIGAMVVEMKALIDELENRQTITCGNMAFERGLLYGHAVILSICSPGKVNAAVYADTMIHLASPDIVINLGTAGALDNVLNIGDIVIADRCVEHDMDTSPIGDPYGYISGLGVTEMVCDKELVGKMVQAAKEVKNIQAHVGLVATGDQFVANKKQKEAILSHFKAMSCEMEGGAIAHACLLRNVPFAIVRSMSDKADGSAHMDYFQFVQLAAQNSIALIKALFKAM